MMVTGLPEPSQSTWTYQIRQPDGEWHYYSRAEWTAETEAEADACRIFGGAFADPSMHRLVRIDRTVV